MLKKCSSCNNKKTLKEFSYRKDKKRLRYSCKSCESKRVKEYKLSPRGKYTSYKYDAKRRNLKFELTFDEFLSFEKTPCEYCGEILDSISLDRVDNNLGYYLENVVSCCYTCNSLKHVLDKEDFLECIEKIYLYQKRHKNDQQEKVS